MRHELTWEMQASGRSTAAAVYERGVMALALALPVPLLAAAGLSLPLPDGVYRLGAAAVQRTASIANALPSIDRGSGEPEQTTVAAKPAMGPTVHRSQARAAIVFSVVAHPAARGGHKPSAAAQASANARAMRRTAVSHSEF